MIRSPARCRHVIKHNAGLAVLTFLRVAFFQASFQSVPMRRARQSPLSPVVVDAIAAGAMGLRCSPVQSCYSSLTTSLKVNGNTVNAPTYTYVIPHVAIHVQDYLPPQLPTVEGYVL